VSPLVRSLPLCVALAAPAFAQMPDMPRAPADQAMMKGMDAMNHAMASAPVTGDPDQDFVAMMIPHHQGAIDMARVELRYGRDPAMRRLATTIVAAQDREITTMRRWQASHKPGSAMTRQP
jgi:uncharacterized protein (DUF305 family)